MLKPSGTVCVSEVDAFFNLSTYYGWLPLVSRVMALCTGLFHRNIALWVIQKEVYTLNQYNIHYVFCNRYVGIIG